MEGNKKNKEYGFLSNEPLGDDLFDNQSQKRVANIINEKIIPKEEFRVIGIDGEWGSGKSNLIRIIEKDLPEQYTVFLYDVWGHQEDDQRRSIMVELTDFITDAKNELIRDKEKWKKKLKYLTSKERNTTTTNIPKLSFGFIISLLLIIYIPAVSTFTREIDSIWWRLGLVFLPILVLIGFYFYKFSGIKEDLKKEESHSNKSFWIRFKTVHLLVLQEVFKVYNDEKVNETKKEVINEDNPTVKDFREWINEIDDDLKTNKKKIIIVFDNFDRLPRKHILKMWSSIHIFFAEKRYKNIKVILPFDRGHLQNAFNHLNNDVKDEKENDKNASKLTTFADDYINKTFDIVFRISQPLMSDWKKFFRIQWKKVFKNERDEELEPVITAFEFLNRRITPREINNLINEILSLKLVDNNYKERYLAIFCLRRNHVLSDPLKAITKFEYLNGLEHTYEYDEKFQKQITAITYQVEVSKAIDLIYTTQLRDALQKNDVEGFNVIGQSSIGNEVFNDSLKDISNYKNAIKTLSKVDDKTKISKSKQKSAWNRFYRVIKAKKLEEKDGFKLENWQLILLTKAIDNDYLESILKSFPSEILPKKVLKYVDSIDEIIESVGQEKVLEFLPEKDVKPDGFVSLVENKGENYKVYNLKCNEQSIDEYLDGLDTSQILNIENTRVLIDNFDLKEYRNSLVKKLDSLSNSNGEDALALIEKLKETKFKIADLNDTLGDAKISSFYTSNKSKTKLRKEMLAIRITRGRNFSQNYRNHFDLELKSEEKELAKKVGGTTLFYISFSELLLIAPDFKGKSLFRNIILALLDNEESRKNENANEVILKYQEIKKSLGIEDNSILKELNNWDFYFNEIEIEKLDDIFVNDCSAVKELEISKAFFERFNNEFREKNEEDFNGLFDNEKNFFFRHFDKLRQTSLTQALFKAFSKKFIERLKNETLKDVWWDMQNRFEKTEISTIDHWKNFRDIIKSNAISWEKKDIRRILKILPFFFENLSVLKDDEDLFRKILKIEFLSNNDYISFLLNNSEQMKTLYQSVNAEDKEVFRNYINEKKDENDSIMNLAQELDIRKSRKDKK